MLPMFLFPEYTIEIVHVMKHKFHKLMGCLHMTINGSKKRDTRAKQINFVENLITKQAVNFFTPPRWAK